MKRFPAGPLLALLPPEPPVWQNRAINHTSIPVEGSGPDLAARLGVTRETVARWRKDQHGLQEVTADRVACALGLHPGLIWPEWWHVEGANWCDCRPPDTCPTCDCNPQALAAS